jgi:hypothetical protein
VKKEGKARQVAKGKVPVGEQWLNLYLSMLNSLYSFLSLKTGRFLNKNKC